MSDGQVERIPFSDPRLGRHIRHDPRSRRFALPRRTPPTEDIRWRRHGFKLNQGNVGACTGFAGVHCLNTDPIRTQVDMKGRRTFRHEDAMSFYSGATKRDPWEGSYPPDDTGSSGLAVCQEMQHQGHITGYEWAFGFQHGLEQMASGPLMQGTWWTWDMFNPIGSQGIKGRVKPTGGDAGGHEYLWIGIEIMSSLSPSQNRSWFFNSWGPWGIGPDGRISSGGYFWMTWEDHEALLARDGDLIRPVV